MHDCVSPLNRPSGSQVQPFPRFPGLGHPYGPEMHRIPVRGLAVVLTVATAVLLVSCADDEPEAAPPTSGTTTEPVEPPSLTPFTEPGEYPVGTYTVALDDGRRVVVWYPAAADAAEQPLQSFDIASLLRPDLQAKIPADLRVAYEVNAHPGADPASGERFPVVLFSHGFAGFPEQSVDLTTHLASWGFIVVAPDHVERSLSGLLGTAAQGVAPREGPEVLAASLDLVEAEDGRAGSPLHDIVDPDHVAVTGHSAGAGAAYRLAGSDDRIDAFITYSVGTGGDDDAEPPPVPDIPGMVMLGSEDGIIPADATREVFDAMASPKYLVELAGAGHLVFSDICLIGGDKGGVIAIADQVGIPVDQFRALGTDGCKPPSPPVTDDFPAIDDLSVDFLRTSLGLQDEPVGLDDPAVVDSFGADVTVTAEP
jgi:predicted dienelactone hydrolase